MVERGFLGVTALLIGVGTAPGIASKAASRLYRASAAAICATLALALAVLFQGLRVARSNRISPVQP